MRRRWASGNSGNRTGPEAGHQHEPVIHPTSMLRNREISAWVQNFLMVLGSPRVWFLILAGIAVFHGFFFCFPQFPLRCISFPLLFICFPLCCIRFLSAPKFLHSMRDLGVTDPSIFGRAGLSEISWGPSTGPSSREARYVISSTWPDIALWRRTVEACVGFLSMAKTGLHTLLLV